MNSLGKSYKIEIYPEVKKISIELQFKEETASIFLYADYKIQNNQIEIENVQCTKQWIQELITYYTNKSKNLKFPLDDFLAQFISKLF